MWICLMLKLVKWNDTLADSDTRLALVAVLYVSVLSSSLSGQQPVN